MTRYKRFPDVDGHEHEGYVKMMMANMHAYMIYTSYIHSWNEGDFFLSFTLLDLKVIPGIRNIF